MKYCYSDESGTSSKEPIAVMAGIVVDVLTMRPTKLAWDGFLVDLSRMAGGRAVEEFHASEFIPGNSPYRHIGPDERQAFVDRLLDFIAARNHRVVYSSVLKASYQAAYRRGAIPDELNNEWRFMGFHLLLAMQKKYPSAKGQTQYVFDQQERERAKFADLVRKPQDWSGEYYGRLRKRPPLHNVIDIPHFADSRHAPLIQLADLVCWVLRRHADLSDAAANPKWGDEAAVYARWVEKIAARSIGSEHIYKKTGRCDAQEYFWANASPAIRSL